MAPSPSLLLSTARGKDVNAQSLIAYLVQAVLTPNAANASGEMATAVTAKRGVAPYLCARKELRCGNGGGVDVYLDIHNHRRGTFLEQSVHLYSAVLEVCPQLSISIIPVMRTGDAPMTATTTTTPASNSAPGSGVEQLQVFADAAEIIRQWQLVDAAAMRGAGDGGFHPFYHYVAVGGTFDHFHSGHKVLLSTAALYALDKLRVGVTDAALLTRKKFAESLQPMERRMDYVAQFLQKVRPDLEFELTVISEMSGGTDKIGAIEALVVSPETEGALPVINEMRAKNGGLLPMAGIAIPQVKSPEGEVISSTVLRSHLIDKE